MSFLSNLGGELGARRRRLRRAVRDFRASLFELLLITGFVLGIAGPALTGRAPERGWLGLAVLAVTVWAYVALDARRQGLLARGVTPEEFEVGHDRLALALLFVGALGAVAVFAFAPGWVDQGPSFVPEAPPEDAIAVDVVN